MGNKLEFEATMNTAGARAGFIELDRLSSMASTRMEATMARSGMTYDAAKDAIDQIAANHNKVQKIIDQEREEATAQVALEEEKLAAAREADALRVEGNRTALANIVAQEREAGIAIQAEQDAILAAQKEKDAARIADEARVQAQTLMAWHRENDARKALLLEQLAAVKAEQLAEATQIARMGGLGGGLGGGHGGTGISGIVGEMLVLVREMGRANFSRIPGSLTILFQRLGLLGMVFTSSAAGAVKTAEAEEKLLVSMSAAARAAEYKAKAMETEVAANVNSTAAAQANAAAQRRQADALLATQVKQKEKTALLKEGAEVELATATNGITMFGRLLSVTIALAAATWLYWRHLKTLNDEMDRTINEAGKGYGDRMKANEEAMKKASQATADQSRWVRDLATDYRDLSEAVDGRLSQMREEFQLQQQLANARGQNEQQRLAAEQRQRESELEVVKQGERAAQEKLAEDKKREEDASKGAYTGTEAIKRQSDLEPGGIAKDQSDREERVRQLEEQKKELQAKIDDTAWVRAERHELDRAKTPGERKTDQYLLDEATRRASGQDYSVGPNGEETQTSMDKVNAELKKQRQAIEEDKKSLLNKANAQRDAVGNLADAKKASEADAAALKNLTKKREDLQNQIESHRRLDAQLAAADSARERSRSARDSASPLVRTGNFLGTSRSGVETLQHEANRLSREHIGVSRQIERNTRPRTPALGERHHAVN